MQTRSLIRRTIAAVALTVACSSATEPEDFYSNWGGDDVRFTLTVTRALFETPCWTADLALPLVVDDDEFTGVGNLVWQGGAGDPQTVSGQFSGKLDGDRLTLTVSPSSLGLGPYELERDRSVEIVGCPTPP